MLTDWFGLPPPDEKTLLWMAGAGVLGLAITLGIPLLHAMERRREAGEPWAVEEAEDSLRVRIAPFCIPPAAMLAAWAYREGDPDTVQLWIAGFGVLLAVLGIQSLVDNAGPEVGAPPEPEGDSGGSPLFRRFGTMGAALVTLLIAWLSYLR